MVMPSLSPIEDTDPSKLQKETGRVIYEAKLGEAKGGSW